MAEASDDRTESATDRRREDAREKGQVARSQDLSGAGLMLAAAAAVLLLTPAMGHGLAGRTAVGLSTVVLRIDPGGALRLGHETLAGIAGLLAPVLLLSFVVALGVNLAQVGFLIAPDALRPKPSRLNPLTGLQRIVSVAGVAKLAVSLGKLAALAAVTTLMLWHFLPALVLLTGADAGSIAGVMHTTAWQLAFALAAVLLALAAGDYAFQLWKHERDLRMTKQEIRDEMKNMDGDPQVRQRRKDAHRKLATSRELHGVKSADVVVTNPTHFAVALKYDPEKMSAPTVVAKGADELALQIRRLAAEHGVPILERPTLARQLFRDVKVGRPIPTDLYEAFVEIMAYVYRLSGKTTANRRTPRRV